MGGCVFRLIVSGSRTMSDSYESTVRRVLDTTSSLFDVAWPELTILHGAARGVDMMASRWCDWEGVDQVQFPARWLRPDGSRDMGAGVRRNAQMLHFGAHACLAIVDKPLVDSAGTFDMVTKARSWNLPTVVVGVQGVNDWRILYQYEEIERAVL